MNNTITVLNPIDHERDIWPVAVTVNDYNGDPVVHVFVTGERVVRIEPLNDWRCEFTLCTTSAERQAHAALFFYLGELTEEQDQRLAKFWGTGLEADVFDDVMSSPADEGRTVIAWLGTVARVIHEESFDTLPEPTGW